MKQSMVWAAIAVAFGCTVGACGQALAQQADPQRPVDAKGTDAAQKPKPATTKSKSSRVGDYHTDSAEIDSAEPADKPEGSAKKPARPAASKARRDDGEQRVPAER